MVCLSVRLGARKGRRRRATAENRRQSGGEFPQLHFRHFHHHHHSGASALRDADAHLLRAHRQLHSPGFTKEGGNCGFLRVLSRKLPSEVELSEHSNFEAK